MLRGPKVVAPKRLSMGEEEDESSDSEWEEPLAKVQNEEKWPYCAEEARKDHQNLLDVYLVDDHLVTDILILGISSFSVGSKPDKHKQLT